MNITRKDKDALNAVLTVEINKGDYEGRVEKMLADYRKNAAIPGFRKGTVPMGMIRKQYGKGLMLEEVNKILQENLNKYIQDEKLDMLGNPLPVKNDSFNWDDETLAFDFEIGLTPDVSVDLEKTSATRYDIKADKKMIDDQIMRIRKQYGKIVSQESATPESDIRAMIHNASEGIEVEAAFTPSQFASAKAKEAFTGKKAGETVTVNSKGLMDDDHKLMDFLKIGHDQVHGLDIDLEMELLEVNKTEPAEMNQELFDKLFGDGNVTSEEAIREKITEDAEKQFAQQADQKFLNDVTQELIAQAKFDLPSEFLKKWIRTAGDKELSAEEAEAEYDKSEQGLRYQLIEGKIITQYGLQNTFDDLKAFTAQMIRKQMAQFGQLEPSDEDVEGIVARVLSNQEEVRRLSEQVMSEKMLNLFKEKVKINRKEVAFDEFVKEMYGE